MKRKKETDKPDRRKIPRLFRAVQRSSHPRIYFAKLIQEDGFNVVCLGSHEEDSSHFLERVIEKQDYEFSAIGYDDFALHARRGIIKMQRDVEDRKLDLEAAVAIADHALEKLNEVKA